MDIPPRMSDVTVVIATRNRAITLRRTLQRLRRLSTSPPIIVVDNASIDETCPMLRRDFPDVTLMRMRHNKGAVARNHGVEEATTPYVAFADDDSWWGPEALARAATLFDTYPRLALVAARTLVGAQERLDPVSAFMASAPLGSPEDLPGPSVLGFLACASVVRREAFLACGGFDPVIFFMGEEARLAYDLYTDGWGLSYCDDVVAHHHPSARPADPHKIRLAARNGVLTCWMRRPLMVSVSETAALARADPRTFVDVLLRLPHALTHRRPPHPTLEAAIDRLAHTTTLS
jgi:GT2 family glycosyltransferase